MIVNNEMSVVVYFSQHCQEYGFEIKDIKVSFPDAIIEHNGISYRTEFEYVSSNFIRHGHDLRECDLIICWKNDCNLGNHPVIELSNQLWHETKIFLMNDKQREISFLKQFYECYIPTINGLKSKINQLENQKTNLQSRIENLKNNKITNENGLRPGPESINIDDPFIIAFYLNHYFQNKELPGRRICARETGISRHFHKRYHSFVSSIIEHLDDNYE